MKNFLIFGDSYSTHKDIIPEGYPHYYSNEGRCEDRPETKMTVSETWWGRFIENDGASLVHNNSWSGSTIGYTGYTGDCSESSSFIYRYDQLLKAGFFDKNEIDTVLVFGGTNDSWSNAPLGEEQYLDFKREDLFSVLPAICYFMKRLKDELPDKRIVFIANCEIKPVIIEAMRHSAERIGVDYVALSDVEKNFGHPTIKGMESIYNQVKKVIFNA